MIVIVIVIVIVTVTVTVMVTSHNIYIYIYIYIHTLYVYNVYIYICIMCIRVSPPPAQLLPFCARARPQRAESRAGVYERKPCGVLLLISVSCSYLALCCYCCYIVIVYLSYCFLKSRGLMNF